MSEETARKAFEDALAALQRDGRAFSVSATNHDLSLSAALEVADEVRDAKRANVIIEWHDNGTVTYLPGRGL